MAEERISIGESSQINEVFYDSETQDLKVVFKSGVYVYHGVDEDTAQGFSGAGSPGRYLNAAIRDQFDYERV